MQQSSQADLQAWIQLASKLDPLEQLALIGLHERNPTLPASSINVAAIVGERKCERASKWLSENIRDLLHTYCDFCSKSAAAVGGKASDTMSMVGAFAALLMATQGYSAAPAAAFAVWAFQSGIKLWCDQYGMVRLDGVGAYRIEVDENYGGDFPASSTSLKIQGAFSVRHYPEINEVVRDARYKHALHKVVIHEEAWISGHFIPDDSNRVDDIVEYGGSRHGHRFDMIDTRSNRTLTGKIDADELKCSATDVEFRADEAQLKAT